MTGRVRQGQAMCGVVCCLILPMCVGGTVAADGNHRFAIRAGKIVTITKGTINHGIVLIRDGKIEAVGPADQVSIPAGYEAVDAWGKWVMPGMIDIHSHAGVQGGLNDMVCQLNPGMRIGDGVDPESDYVEAALAAGVTTLQVVPGSGTNHSGFGVTYKTAGATKKERLVRRVGVMKITQAYNPERRAGDIGTTRMGMTWLLREHLERARGYDAAWTAYERGDRGQAPERDIALEFARPVFRGELPVLIHTYETWGVLTTMVMFHDEFSLKGIATHAAYDGHRMAQEAAKRAFPINIGPRVVDFYGHGDARFRGMVPTYREGGATEMSVNTDSFGFGQALLAVKAAMAARFGLDDEEALRLVTINPARAMLLDHRIGSIEVGKDADLVIKQTSLLDPTTPVEMVFVNGKIAYDARAEE
ncbi:MAG: amidohydrolase family protein [Armatimonadota bacterium]